MGYRASLLRFLSGEIKPIFRKQYLREDIGASIAVAFVAIPLSLAVSLATGVGAEVGLISAVIGGILGALFGGCRLSVTGPAVAMSVLLANTMNEFGFAGLLVAGFVCGVLQIVFGVSKLGRVTKYIPLSLILAFTAGIGFLLFFEQLPHIFQLAEPDNNTIGMTVRHAHLYLRHISSAGVLLTVLTIVILSIVPHYLPRAYSFVFAVIIPMAIIHFTGINVNVVGEIPHDLIHPEIIDFSLIHNWHRLLITALEVFILASLETLLSSSAVDLMGKGDLHNPNQELIGQGIANIGTSIFGGIPVTGVVARSSVNVLAGAKTRRAAIFHSFIVLAVVYFAPQLIENMPVAVLSGILLAAAFKMMNIRQVIDLWRSDRVDVLIYFITFFAIICTDLVSGIQTGLLAAFIIVGFRMLRTRAEIKLWTNNNVLRVGLAGNISFLSYEKLANIKEFVQNHKALQFVVFEFADLHNIDSGGAKHLISIADELTEAGLKVVFHSMKDYQQNIIIANTFGEKSYHITIAEHQIKDLLEKSGVTHSANDVLRHGITKYVSHYAQNNQQLITTLAQGQKPHTLLITCSDSRLNPNAFFSANIGEIFIVRNVGNVVPPYMPDNIYSEIAAIEYAIAELGVRNIVICAHTECGAVKASVATGDDKLGYIGLDNWLGLIKAGFKINKPKDAAEGVRINLLHQVQNLKTYPGIGEMLARKELTLNAWIYDVHSGHMLEWSNEKRDFVQIV
ncbi:MAG TPA: bifunctional SulP family inorganic anion transporter/carbonic anhydrase [Burkholderiales bacterium]|nr:bifunctional SulP family inorganic anion transporter/carbonic anhydrase [Burkholderiales bacterium]